MIEIGMFLFSLAGVEGSPESPGLCLWANSMDEKCGIAEVVLGPPGCCCFQVSVAARGLCLWVRAMETYGHVAKDVAPKRAKLKAAQDNLAKKQAALSAAQQQLAQVLDKVQALKDR